MFGLPSSERILDIRRTGLQQWKEAVDYFNQENSRKAAGLFEVFNYCREKQRTEKVKYNPDLVILSISGNESALMNDSEIFTNKDKFNKEIDYRLTQQGENWFVAEQRVYSRFFKEDELLKIDDQGVISLVNSQE